MNKIIRILGIATLVACMTTGVEAQEKRKEKPGFFKQAFRDMKESAKRQREIDRAKLKNQKFKILSNCLSHSYGIFDILKKDRSLDRNAQKL